MPSRCCRIKLTLVDWLSQLDVKGETLSSISARSLLIEEVPRRLVIVRWLITIGSLIVFPSSIVCDLLMCIMRADQVVVQLWYTLDQRLHGEVVKLSDDLDEGQLIDLIFLAAILIIRILVFQEALYVVLLFEYHPVECHVVVAEKPLFHKLAILVHGEPDQIEAAVCIP